MYQDCLNNLIAEVGPTRPGIAKFLLISNQNGSSKAPEHVTVRSVSSSFLVNVIGGWFILAMPDLASQSAIESLHLVFRTKACF